MSAKAMQQMAEKIQPMLPKSMGFALLVFPKGNPGILSYISDCVREDMVKILRETADRLENKEDYQTNKDTIYGT